eukprot:scaffold14471_cov113-Isochrysis_galbana.AAC.14
MGRKQRSKASAPDSSRAHGKVERDDQLVVSNALLREHCVHRLVVPKRIALGDVVERKWLESALKQRCGEFGHDLVAIPTTAA